MVSRCPVVYKESGEYGKKMPWMGGLKVYADIRSSSAKMTGHQMLTRKVLYSTP